MFCALQHSQGSQAVILCQKMRFLFCTLQHFQGSQTFGEFGNSFPQFYTLRHLQGSQATYLLYELPSCFIPHDTLKVLKQNNQTRWLHLVLYPTTFSRFSSAVIDAVFAKWFCTLRHAQGFQAIQQLCQACQRFYTIRHSQGYQAIRIRHNVVFGFVPNDILKVFKLKATNDQSLICFVPYSITKVLKPAKNL